VSFLYYKAAEVSKVSPSCGPLSGYTQLAVIGANFVDLGRDQIMCGFKQEDTSNAVDGGSGVILTNASIINSTFVVCDSPSMMNKQGYAVDADNAWFDVFITLDGGSQLSDSSGRFEYYADPFINELSPALGPMNGGTIVTVNGTGFDQNTTCGIIIRLGIIELRPMSVTNESMIFKAPKSPLPGTAAFSVSLNGQQFSKQPAVADLPKEFVYDFYEPPYTSFYYPARGPSNGANFQRHQGFGYMLGRPHLNDRLWVRLINPDTKKPVTENIEIPQDDLHIDEWTWTLPPVNGPQETYMQITLNQ
jgi:hypothetical protein